MLNKGKNKMQDNKIPLSTTQKLYIITVVDKIVSHVVWGYKPWETILMLVYIILQLSKYVVDGGSKVNHRVGIFR